MTTLNAAYTLGEPQVAGALAVYPVLGPEPGLAYHGLSRAIELGAFVKEHDGGASVREVILENPTDLPVLLYEGEHISGAQQNRSVDASLLVPAKSGVEVPVSCIERGRWDGARHREPFARSRHAADPALRAIKREDANRRADGRPDQGRVWAEVGGRLAVHGVASHTDSLEDLFEMRAYHGGDQTAAIKPVKGQIGALVEIAGRPVALDLVSRAEVYAELAPALASGYALQAHHERPADPDDARAARFLAKAIDGRRAANRGLGHAFTVSRKRLVGAGVEHDGELVALSAFRRESVGPNA